MANFLQVMDPMEGICIAEDTTFAFQWEAQARGHVNHHCLVDELSFKEGRPVARCRSLEVHQSQGDHFRFGDTVERPLDSFECVMMRKDPPFDMRYVFATHLLSLADTFVMNRPDSLRNANEKLYALEFPEWTPTVVTTSIADVREFLASVGGSGVLKPLDGAGGVGVLRVDETSENLNAIVEMMTAGGCRQVVVQEYLPAIRKGGDHRILLVDGISVGGVARIPPEGDLRGNLHVGATAEKMVLSDRERAICEAIGPRLREDGLWFVGIDVIGDYMTEINVTSPTGVQEINALDGVCVEALVIDMVESQCA
jgi:glutathione synthase